jgi:hypothetical protein
MQKVKKTIDKFDIDIKLNLYLISNGNKIKCLKNVKKDLRNYISKNKIIRIKKIIYNIFNFTYDIKKYKYDKKLSTIQMKMKIKKKSIKFFLKDYDNLIYFKNNETIFIKDFEKKFKKHLIDYYGNIGKKCVIGEGGVDTWMSGDICLLDEDEYNKNMYEMGVSVNNFTIR